MNQGAFAKCTCRACGIHLEFPLEAAGALVMCPHCQQETELTVETPVPDSDQASAMPAALRVADLQAAFTGEVLKTRVSFLYQVGLIVVAIAMVILPLIYVALIGLAGWATYYWATHFTGLLGGSGGPRLMLFRFICYIAPIFAGVVLTFFMIKPLFARRAPKAQPLALNPGAEPLLFSFVFRLCQTVGAPCPARIDVDCNLNAAAGFRRGMLSFLGNDLVLTIGLPLVAALNLRQFAGVIAHEFGHFTQGFAMRLTYVIRSVNAWFARVAYERDRWDLTLEEWGETESGYVAIVVATAQFGVWFSRLILKALMLIGHGIGCFMLRQMEYDADSYEIKLAGSEAFESTARELHVLSVTLDKTYKDIRVPWNLSRRLPDNFPRCFMEHAATLPLAQRTKLEDTMGLHASGMFDTHPSNGDRIRRARQAGEPGVFHFDGPASVLFSNFDVVCKQVTLLHYSDDLAIPLAMARLVPTEELHGQTSETDAADSGTAAGERPRFRLKSQG